MFTNHNTKDIYENNVENRGQRDRKKKEREKILLKQEPTIRRCSPCRKHKDDVMY